MTAFGYTLSCEEQPASRLLELGRQAEDSGFDFAMISDHFHPWSESQGHSPFVWTVLGGLATTTRTMSIGTGVTCPIIRYHPALIAQAAATVLSMMPGRFFLGLGSGENLNEHVTGEGWPSPDLRLSMLDEALQVIRELMEGAYVTFRGRFYTVERAKIFEATGDYLPIVIAAKGDVATSLAAISGDGLCTTAPDGEQVRSFEAQGGRSKPRYAQVNVCWAPTREQAIGTAFAQWPNAVVGGDLNAELPVPRDFEDAVSMVEPRKVADQIPCGPDAQIHIDEISRYVEAGFDHIYLHQIGPDQEGFFRFWVRELQPALETRFSGRPTLSLGRAEKRAA